MPEPTLALGYTDFLNEAGLRYGVGGDYTAWSSLSPDPTTTMDSYVQKALRQAYYPPPLDPRRPDKVWRWSFLTKIGTMHTWGESTGTATLTKITATIAKDNGTSTVTANKPVFTTDMVGMNLHTASENYYPIASFTSSTVIAITGDGSGDTGDAIMVSDTDTYDGPWTHCAATTGDDTFYDSMVGATLTCDTSSNEYSIIGYMDADEIILDGDASGDTGDDYTIENTGVYRLPSDFAAILGDFRWAYNQYYAPIPVIDEGRLMVMRPTGATGGVPTYAAIRPVNSDGSAGQRQEVQFHVWPSSHYELAYRYQVLCNKLSATNPYPLGGPMFGELVRLSCRAVVEKEFDRIRGEDWRDFMDYLAMMIGQDAKKAPLALAVNVDRAVREPRRVPQWYPIATHDGRYSE